MLGKWWIAFQDSNATMSKRKRRVFLGIFVLGQIAFLSNAIIFLLPRLATSRFYGFVSCCWALLALVSAMGWKNMRHDSITSWNQRAMMEFGKPYTQLQGREQILVRAETARQIQQEAQRPLDERDDNLQRDAERRAYRMLKIILPVFLLVYWSICLFIPGKPVRLDLLSSAVALTLMTVLVLCLPEVIRQWTDSGEALEPKVVAVQRREA